MLVALRHFLELIRFSHTVFALPFALLAAVMAWRAEPAITWRWQDLAGIVLCMIFARSTAMAFNRIVDRDVDAQNPRTARRHIPAGLLSVGSVTLFAVASAGLFVGSTLCFWPNRWPLYLSLPVLAFLCGYSLTKRFTSLAHFWLGTALCLSPIAAWIALRGGVDPSPVAWPPVVLAGAVLLWVSGFDIIYACQDVDVDRQLRLNSVPARLGVPGALRLAAGCHLGMLVVLALLPVVFPLLGWIYWTGIAAVAVLLAYEHALVRPDDLTRVNTAFFHVNAVVSLGLFAVTTLDLLV
jgi:4-hydroxybenzoate polyprenyltransferase